MGFHLSVPVCCCYSTKFRKTLLVINCIMLSIHKCCFTVEQGMLVDTLPMPYRDELKGLSKASNLNLGELVDFII